MIKWNVKYVINVLLPCTTNMGKGISKSLLSQLGIHLLLGKQGKKDSNSLANKLGKNINLAYLLSARANIRAPTPVGIVIFAAPPLLPRSRSVGASSPRAPLLLPG